jgi:MazG family protein
MAGDPRIVVVETAAALPGLLPVEAWDALRTVDRVVATDPEHHPSTPYLTMAGVEVTTLEPAPLTALRGADLLGGADPTDRRLALALLQAADGGPVAIVLGAGDERLPRAIGMEAAKVGGVEVEFVFLTGTPIGLELLRLTGTMARLRDPDGGCPWDLEQTHASLARYLLEETYELLDAIEADDDRHLAEELGDLLLQVVFHAQVAADRGAFTIDDVAQGISDKLVRRHPHVFADGDATTADEVQQNWDELKAAEKPEREGPFDGVPTSMPALLLTEELQRKAAKLGFDWPSVDDHLSKVREEIDELAAAVADGDADAIADELGDVLGALTSVGRTLGIVTETALRGHAGKFRTRFEQMLRRADRQGVDLGDLDRDGWLALWTEVKGAGF